MRRLKQVSKLLFLSLIYTEFISPSPFLLHSASPYSSLYKSLLSYCPDSLLDWLHGWNKLMIRYKVVRSVKEEKMEGMEGRVAEGLVGVAAAFDQSADVWENGGNGVCFSGFCLGAK
jgi:hypothetical protein